MAAFASDCEMCDGSSDCYSTNTDCDSLSSNATSQSSSSGVYIEEIVEEDGERELFWSKCQLQLHSLLVLSV